MLKWLSGSTTTSIQQHNDSDKTGEEQAAAAAPSFPMPGSIQRVGGSSLKRLEKQEEGTSAGDSDEDDEDTNAIANMDLHISPPSPVSSKPPKVATSAPETLLQQDSKSEFKVPTVSFTVSAPSSVNTPAMTSAKAKPKPSHRPFPPDPSSTISPASTLNNGRVTLSNGSNGATLGSSLGLPPSTTVKPRKQRFVALEPGYSPLDWARLNREGDDDELRCGFDKPQRFTLQEVSEHATKADAWSVFHGKVYNITPYLYYHPGGVKELMRVAGKDGTELFMQTHAWVNAELMMEGCLIGFLVRE